ncbi:DUF1501 domain-containing protein [Massilia sp. G4R7]|uniref:DUF1501 domain-containing protein n=1 Tax=Massilia phyllostachyos TaxID=2898585 RepID=A0ABS8Q8Q6_9BURK|nr:DUF1501 domain-containing protein [Massilia phyllostachyos]MCD2518145.1 DUF1501 domain-containing protein [Massilia phyllostachyos]
MTNRRHFLLGAAALLAAPRITFAQAPTSRRFVFILQRGAADGLNTVIPYADPAYASLRGELAIGLDAAAKLDGTFALHSSLAEMKTLYDAGQATFFHAVASPYRERSHFDGQNVLETGGTAPYALKDGWMNRLLASLSRKGREGIAFSPTVPMAMRGKLEVSSYAPSNLPHANEDLMLRIEQLYGQDAQLHALWSAAQDARSMAGEAAAQARQNPQETGRMAASFLARADGPRIAMIETNGWDTHSGQNGRLAGQLRNLDNLVAGLRQGLGPVWDQTVILVATEFGRTAAANGTGGTDHGTGAAAMLLGGAVKGGRVVADWPGLAPADLYEGRDLRPTLGLDTLIAQVCAEAFKADPGKMARVLFPSTKPGKPLDPLLRA